MHAIKFILLPLLLLPATLFGQATFQQGKITTLSGTTHDAKILAVTWVHTPRSFVFSTSGGQEEQATVENTAAVQIIGGRRFERAVVLKSLNRIKYPRIPSRPDNRMVRDTVFLEVLAEGGKVALFSLTDSIKTRYFVRQSGGAAEELRYQIYRAREQGGKIIEVNTYREQLTSLAAGGLTGEVAKAINRAKYDREELSDLINRLNGGETTYNSKAVHGPVRFMAGAGVNVTTLKFSGAADIANADPDHITSAFPLAGVEWTLDQEKENMVIQVGATAMRAKAFFTTSDEYFRETRAFTQWTVGIAPVYLYRFINRPRLKVSAGTGIAINYFSYFDDHETYQLIFSSMTPQKLVRHGGFQRLSYGWPVRAGVSIGKIDAMVTWSTELTNLVNMMETELSRNTASVSLTYVFGR